MVIFGYHCTEPSIRGKRSSSISHSAVWVRTFCSKWKFGYRFCIPVDILFCCLLTFLAFFLNTVPLKNPQHFSSVAFCLGSPVLNLNNSLVMHLKPEDRKYDNKYAQQLEADYQSLTLSSSFFERSFS